jgi:hypothetical protein
LTASINSDGFLELNVYPGTALDSITTDLLSAAVLPGCPDGTLLGSEFPVEVMIVHIHAVPEGETFYGNATTWSEELPDRLTVVVQGRGEGLIASDLYRTTFHGGIPEGSVIGVDLQDGGPVLHSIPVDGTLYPGGGSITTV